MTRPDDGGDGRVSVGASVSGRYRIERELGQAPRHALVALEQHALVEGRELRRALERLQHDRLQGLVVPARPGIHQPRRLVRRLARALERVAQHQVLQVAGRVRQHGELLLGALDAAIAAAPGGVVETLGGRGPQAKPATDAARGAAGADENPASPPPQAPSIRSDAPSQATIAARTPAAGGLTG